MSSKVTLILFAFTAWLVIQTVAIKTRKIRVLISQRSPFAVHPIGCETIECAKDLEGLDILILNDFAKNRKFEIEYSISNISLHHVLASDKLAYDFFKSPQIS